MYEVLGYVHRRGEYQGRPYDNYYLHCRKLEVPDNHVGQAVEVLKVPADLLDLSSLVMGAVFDVYYNRFGRVLSLAFR